MNLLFVCTHNRCRSILCEALTRDLDDPRYQARSAGSAPSGQVHPKTLEHLQALGIDTEHLHSKSWQALGDYQPDVVITVCDSAAGEACPLWLGDTLRVHWGLSDPSATAGSAEAVDAAFSACIAQIRQRLDDMRKQKLANMPSQQWPAAFAALGAQTQPLSEN